MNSLSTWHHLQQTNTAAAQPSSIGVNEPSSSSSSPSRVASAEAMNLKVAQTEAWREAPDTSKSPLYQYSHGEASNTFRNTSAPIVPLLKATPSLRNLDLKVKKRAYTSALYYSECFLNGITPQQADKAAQTTQGQYQKWWVRATARDENVTGDSSSPRGDDSYNKRKHGTVVSDEGSLSSVGVKRRRRGRPTRGRPGNGVRDLIDELPRVRRLSLSSASSCSSPWVLPEERGTSNERVASEERHITIHNIPNLSEGVTAAEIEDVRERVISELFTNGGDVTTPNVKHAIELLESFYASGASVELLPSENSNATDFAVPSSSSFELDGAWLSLTKPTYTGCHGVNASQESIYSLGQMAFDMFRPTSLKCSIQGTINTVHRVDKEEILGTGVDAKNLVSIPRSLRKEIRQSLEDGSAELRTYNIVVAFTIEPGQTITRSGGKQSTTVRQPIRGILTNYGYLVPDPKVPDRYSIWFTGGCIEVNDEERDMEGWRAVFDEAPGRDMVEYARVLAAKLLLGAEIADTMSPNGTMTYSLRRPIGGHGSAFCDVLYLDEKLRVMRGHHGSLYCFVKVLSEDETT